MPPILLLEFGSWITNLQWYLGSGAHSEFRSTTKDTNNLELGGIRLIEATLPDGTIVYRESNFGQETEVPIFIGNSILFTVIHSKIFFSFMFRHLLQNSW